MASPCHFLDMAPELRNAIYRLVFEPDQDPSTETLLCEATPPSINVLKTCKQAYDEAKGLYRSARDEYWSGTHFKVVEDNPMLNGGNESHVEGIHTKELNLIRHLQVHLDRSIIVTLVDYRGGWLCDEFRDRPYVLIRPSSKARKGATMLFIVHMPKETFVTERELICACNIHGQGISVADQIRYWVEWW